MILQKECTFTLVDRVLAKSRGRKGFHTKIAREVKWKTNQKAVLQNRDYIQTFLGRLRFKKKKKVLR